MERLTNNKERDYTNSENLKIIQKLKVLEDLEEEIGCPIEVLFRALKDGVYIKKDKQQRNFYCLGYNMKIYTQNFDDTPLKTKDYKKTWWLKADKSE